jgi:hypothetical protein
MLGFRSHWQKKAGAFAGPPAGGTQAQPDLLASNAVGGSDPRPLTGSG